MVGRLVRIKRHRDFISALRLLKINTNWNGKAVIIGDGPLYGKLKKQISKYELTDNVFLPGFMEADTKAHYLKQSRFYVLSSSREGFSISTLEAMQFGCIPIVSRPSSSEVFGVSHFVTDGVNGFYYDVANLKNFADVLEKALKIGLRTEYQFKRTAYDTSGNFEWGKLLDKLTL